MFGATVCTENQYNMLNRSSLSKVGNESPSAIETKALVLPHPGTKASLKTPRLQSAHDIHPARMVQGLLFGCGVKLNC